ncbi:50S ribosomal protein L16 [Candidatus Micrarchaeota archaeon]|nr:50S ribosomal protein L16 [Candidatus Micrarchaeota archaeon]
MGIRPAKTVRESQGQPWARISNRVPRKSYVKGAPRPKVRQYNMGVDRFYDTEVNLNAVTDIQLRDNSMEAARQAAVKFLEKHLPNQYYFGILKYPHLIIREHSALGVAGADRISKGMKRAFGRPKGRMARIKHGESVFTVRINSKDIKTVKDALRRAKLKMSGSFVEVVRNISQDKKNLAKVGKEIIMKVKVTEEKKKEETPAAGAVAAVAGAEGAKEGEKAAEAKPEAKKEEKKK